VIIIRPTSLRNTAQVNYYLVGMPGSVGPSRGRGQIRGQHESIPYTSQPHHTLRRVTLLHIAGITDYTYVGRIFTVCRSIRVTLSYVLDFTLLVHFPIKHRRIVPHPLRSCDRCRTPYDDSVEFSIFSDIAYDAAQPVTSSITSSSSFTFHLHRAIFYS